jgi:hypothetical protein
VALEGGGELEVTVRFAPRPGVAAAASGAVRVRSTDPDQSEAEVALVAQVNRAPVAFLAGPSATAPGATVTLSGAESFDADGHTPLTHAWTVLSRPVGATAALSGASGAQTQLTMDPDVPGEYRVALAVTDALGAQSLEPAVLSVVAAPSQQLLVELFWDNAGTDLDLHLLRHQSAPLNTAPDDCFYQAPRPDWGIPGDAADDPAFVRDALQGYGPELVGYPAPLPTGAGRYRVVVDFKNDHLSARPESRATVRVYVQGVVAAELTRTLLREGDRWVAADIAWPDGTVTAP